ncbi:MAG TPA: hypothetical protein VJ276_09335 [Thermoanaerobaculia bacterium]|nr:hypothetical protein [Thermoanaerobaculia bacterium]
MRPPSARLIEAEIFIATEESGRPVRQPAGGTPAAYIANLLTSV